MYRKVIKTKKRAFILIAIVFVIVYFGFSKIFTPKTDSQLETMAWEMINKDSNIYEEIPWVKIIEKKITKLELGNEFNIANSIIKVYRLEFRLKPNDLSKITIAGGMETDENG